MAGLDPGSADPEVQPELETGRGRRLASGLSVQARLTLTVILAAVGPLLVFGGLLVLLGFADANPTLLRLLLLAAGVAGLLGALVAYPLTASVTSPLREIAEAVERASGGGLVRPLQVPGDDSFARLAESHNRMTADIARRTRQLNRILAALFAYSPRDGIDHLLRQAGADAREAFDLIDVDVRLGDPADSPPEERVPGEPQPVRAVIRVGVEPLGLIRGHVPATRSWEPADGDLLDLLAAVVGVAIRTAELFGQVEAQNRRLQELDTAKDEFLRGVSHNLQTPLARIGAYAEQLAAEGDDRRPVIIAEQSERLSRMVRQLLTVTRLEAGTLRSETEVMHLASRLKRAWEALGAGEVPLTLDDRSAGWLAVGDGDQIDQVLWAILDNAVKYGGGGPVEATLAVDEAGGQIRLTIADHGPGVAEDDRARLFRRFGRLAQTSAEEGSGLGLYVSRELVRGMGGEVLLEPSEAGRGAAFSIVLPAEAPLES